VPRAGRSSRLGWNPNKPPMAGPSPAQEPDGPGHHVRHEPVEALCVYSTDGRLNIDNNCRRKRASRIGRSAGKNWLFCGRRQRRCHRRRPIQLHRHLRATQGRSVRLPPRRATPHRRHPRSANSTNSCPTAAAHHAGELKPLPSNPRASHQFWPWPSPDAYNF